MFVIIFFFKVNNYKQVLLIKTFPQFIKSKYIIHNINYLYYKLKNKFSATKLLIYLKKNQKTNTLLLFL